jgi:receptor protein-tyrosine kinase
LSIIEKAVAALTGDSEIPAPAPPEIKAEPSPPDTAAEAMPSAPKETAKPVASRFERSFSLGRDGVSSLTGTRPPWKASNRPASVKADLARLSAAGLLVPGNVNATTQAEFARIREQLLRSIDAQAADSDSNSNVVVVTSALHKEGKTFTAISLASSLTMDTDLTVLFIDADVMKGGASGRFGVSSGAGFSDLLADPSMDIGDALLKTNIERFALLPSGRKRINLTELFSSERMEQLIDSLSRRYADRIIVIDGPALLSFSSAPVLAGRAGQVLMVVEAGRTPRAAITQGLALLENCRHVGLVLNRHGRTSAQAA